MFIGLQILSWIGYSYSSLDPLFLRLVQVCMTCQAVR